MRGVAVLGSTGTIGTFTLEIIKKYPDKFQVYSLACGSNIEKVVPQIETFSPKVVFIHNPESLAILKERFPRVEFVTGDEGWEACINHPLVDVVVHGVVGFQGLLPALVAIRSNKLLALANKESLVVAGSLIKKALIESKATLIPVDSEHNALYQLLRNRNQDAVDSIVLTASGGPLLKRPELPLEDVTPEIAIKHPNWNMGPKISVDSATLMNKGLELIEAHYLFGVPEKKIEVWVHPQSIVHGAIWLKDNSCLAQLTRPDMKSSIGYAMQYPDILDSVIERFTFKDIAELTFLEPDTTRFPLLKLARLALNEGPSALTVLNAANEVAVGAFLKGHLLFSQISRVVERALESHKSCAINSFEAIYELDLQTRETLKLL